MAAFEIPLSANAQTFDIVLSGIDYFMQVVWNSIASCWILDIADSNNNPLIQGIPLITGADLLAQYQSVGIGGSLVVSDTSGAADAVPTYAGLGTSGHLYFFT